MRKSITLHLTDTEATIVAVGLMLYEETQDESNVAIAGDIRQRITELMKAPTTEDVLRVCRERTQPNTLGEQDAD